MYETLPFLDPIGSETRAATLWTLIEAQSGFPPCPPNCYVPWNMDFKFAVNGRYLRREVEDLVAGDDSYYCGLVALLTAFFLHLPKGDHETRLPAKKLEEYSVAVLHRIGTTCYRVCTFRRIEDFPFEQYGYQPNQVIGRLIEIVQYGPLTDNISDAFNAFAVTLLFKNWARMNNVLRFEPFRYCRPGPEWTCANPEAWPSDYRIHQYDEVEDARESIVGIVESGMNFRRKGVYGLLMDRGLELLELEPEGVWDKLDLIVYDEWCVISVQTNETGDVGMQDKWKWHTDVGESASMPIDLT